MRIYGASPVTNLKKTFGIFSFTDTYPDNKPKMAMFSIICWRNKKDVQRKKHQVETDRNTKQWRLGRFVFNQLAVRMLGPEGEKGEQMQMAIEVRISRKENKLYNVHPHIILRDLFCWDINSHLWKVHVWDETTCHTINLLYSIWIQFKSTYFQWPSHSRYRWTDSGMLTITYSDIHNDAT